MDVYEMLFEKDIYIWGTGKRGIKISQVLDYFNIPIKGYIDNDSSKHGNFLGKKCTGLSELVGKQNILVVISPVETRGICEQLDEVNIPYVLGKDIYRDYYFMPPKKESSDYCSVKPFNFYESPYADLREIHDREAEIFDHSKKVLDVDFNIKRQLTLLETMRKTPIIPWDMGKTEKYRYYYNNYMYPRGSADVLYYMMNIIKPKRIIEVGSGFSTAVMLDTNNNCFNNKIKIVSIEPYADRLKSLLRDNDNLEIYECNLQMIPLDFFNQLEKNDILFY